MSTLKTQKTDASVDKFLNSVNEERKRKDSFTILEIMKEITGDEPAMWGPSIIGFGSYHYKYKSGREGDWFLTGFSPRKQSLTLYLHYGFDQYESLLNSLGKHKTGKACLYINKLDDVDKSVLKELIKKSVDDLKKLNE
jgi:hypothetical protein